MVNTNPQIDTLILEIRNMAELTENYNNGTSSFADCINAYVDIKAKINQLVEHFGATICIKSYTQTQLLKRECNE